MIKVQLNKYRLDISNDNEHIEYMRITKKAKALGHKLFDSICSNYASSFQDKLPTTATIETDFLFTNQYNTVEGSRIFDWSESIVRNKNLKIGYYLTGDIDALKAAKASQLCCGYCGKRYDARNTDQKYCTSCIGSEHLTEDTLYLLQLLPIGASDKLSPGRDKVITEELKESYEKNKFDFEAAQATRLKIKAAKLLTDLDKDVKEMTYKTGVIYDLLTNGVDTENLIYYSHKNEWSYGWRTKVSKGEFEEFRQKCSKLVILADANGIDFVNLLSMGRWV